MRPIPFEAKMEVLELYLKGDSTNDIVTKTNISKGTVVSIIQDAREGKFPQLELKNRVDELHSLSLRLRKGELDLGQVKLGVTILRRLLEMGIEPDKIKHWVEFCSEISPTPAEGFIPSAIEFHRVEKETGMSYAEIAAKVKELAEQKDKLTEEVADLGAKEIRVKELGSQIGDDQEKLVNLRSELANLEARTDILEGLIQKRADELGITHDELVTKLAELVSFEAEIANRRREKNKLDGEIEALTESQQKLSSRMEKASADFDEKLELLSKMTEEYVEIAEMMGKWDKELDNMIWARDVLPFLSDPDKVRDDDFNLIAIVVNCVDKWLQAQYEWTRLRYAVTWEDIKKHVQSKRAEFE